MQKVFRVGVYGIVQKENDLLVITQERGPYAGWYDLPGGGIEFGESPESALKREFMEEVGMEFKSSSLLANFSHMQDVPSINDKPSFTFHQLGLIYKVTHFNQNTIGCLTHMWIDIDSLKNQKKSPFLERILYDNLLILS